MCVGPGLRRTLASPGCFQASRLLQDVLHLRHDSISCDTFRRHSHSGRSVGGPLNVARNVPRNWSKQADNGQQYRLKTSSEELVRFVSIKGFGAFVTLHRSRPSSDSVPACFEASRQLEDILHLFYDEFEVMVVLVMYIRGVSETIPFGEPLHCFAGPFHVQRMV